MQKLTKMWKGKSLKLLEESTGNAENQKKTNI